MVMTKSRSDVRRFLTEVTWIFLLTYLLTYLSRDYIAACDCAVVRCQSVAETNQTNMTDYDILASSLVIVGCLAKRKCRIIQSVPRRLDMEQFHHFGTY